MKKDLVKYSVIVILIIIAVFSRLIPHPSNFTALGAVAIFSTFVFPNRYLALLVPVLSMWLSDLIINNIVYSGQEFTWFTGGFAWIYAGILSHTLFAMFFRKPDVAGIAGSSLAGAVFFFLISNFGVWAGSAMYEHSVSGLILCYTAALPFFGNILASNLLFSAALFGTCFIFEKKYRIFHTA